jgi:pimeloyl-ACP methyl ester carboxylesterase
MTPGWLGRRLALSPNPAENPARMFGPSMTEETMATSTWWPLARRTRSTDAVPERVPGPTRRGRGFLVWTGGIVAVLLALATLGALYESAAEAADARAYPPPGRMVDVGGHRLHINCVGAGSPTVVIDAGWMDWSTSWSSWVQPGVAESTRVCTYDRAGYGYSEPGPLPRSAERVAEELHTLLQRADVPGPYVVVGHSLGGAHVRVFAHAYPAEVAGVVLIESMNPRTTKPLSPSAPADAPSRGDWLLTLPARVGAMRVLAGPLGLKSGWAPGVADAYAALWVTPRYLQTTIDEGRGIADSLAQARAITSLGATPLIVLSRGRDQDAVHVEEQAQLLELSSNSQQMVAGQSGHNVQVDQPAAAVEAITQMVAQVRGQAPR